MILLHVVEKRDDRLGPLMVAFPAPSYLPLNASFTLSRESSDRRDEIMALALSRSDIQFHSSEEKKDERPCWRSIQASQTSLKKELTGEHLFWSTYSCHPAPKPRFQPSVALKDYGG